MRVEVELLEKHNIKMFRKCKDCNNVYERSGFSKRKGNKWGISHRCLNCTNKKFIQNKRNYYNRNKESIVLQSRERYCKLKNDEQYQLVLKEKNSDYYVRNKNRINKRTAEYKRNNKEKHNFHEATRRANKLKATPEWSNLDKIKILYQKAKWLESVTGFKYHVDHVVPLKGKNVCGLHVWENLQILESSLNCSKNNNWEV